MKICRRKLILSTFSSILAASSLYYYFIKDEHENVFNLNSFFENYESIIPLDDILILSNKDIIKFQDLLLSTISSKGEQYTKLKMSNMIRRDFQVGNIRLMNGWILSEVEFYLEILRKQHV
jgi:hypothetical protein